MVLLTRLDNPCCSSYTASLEKLYQTSPNAFFKDPFESETVKLLPLFRAAG